MRTILAIALASVLTACGGSYSNQATPAQTNYSSGDITVISPTGGPAWELGLLVPLEADEEVFSALVDGYTGLVIGKGTTYKDRYYDACAYIVSTYKVDSFTYKAMLAHDGYTLYLNGTSCNAKIREGILILN